MYSVAEDVSGSFEIRQAQSITVVGFEELLIIFFFFGITPSYILCAVYGL